MKIAFIPDGKLIALEAENADDHVKIGRLSESLQEKAHRNGNGNWAIELPVHKILDFFCK